MKQSVQILWWGMKFIIMTPDPTCLLSYFETTCNCAVFQIWPHIQKGNLSNIKADQRKVLHIGKGAKLVFPMLVCWFIIQCILFYSLVYNFWLGVSVIRRWLIHISGSTYIVNPYLIDVLFLLSAGMMHTLWKVNLSVEHIQQYYRIIHLYYRHVDHIDHNMENIKTDNTTFSRIARWILYNHQDPII